MQGFTSLSVSERVSMQFASRAGRGTLLRVFNLRSGVSVQAYSTFPTEQDSLIARACPCCVLRVCVCEWMVRDDSRWLLRACRFRSKPICGLRKCFDPDQTSEVESNQAILLPPPTPQTFGVCVCVVCVVLGALVAPV